MTCFLVPPIVITKAQSIASVESFHASTSAYPTSGPIQNHTESEKPPVIQEEQTQEHRYGKPPSFEEQAETSPKSIIKDTKPVIIATPEPLSDQTITTTTEPKPEETEKSTSPLSPLSPIYTPTDTTSDSNAALWTILVRLSTSGAKDKVIDIPTSPPFMKVSELKNMIDIESDQQIKLIHLGRILQDDYILVPSSTTSSKSDTIKISNRGVIQAMVYRS